MQIETKACLRPGETRFVSTASKVRLVGLVGLLIACGGNDASDAARDSGTFDASPPGDDNGDRGDASATADASPTNDAAGDAGCELDGASNDAASAGAANNPDPDAPPVDNDDFAAALRGKLMSCGLLADTAPVQLESLRSPAARCAVFCLANASCAQLTSKYCGAVEEAALKACQDVCTFVCTDGSSTASAAQCDGQLDCSNGSDEADCDDYYFTCGDGTQINGTLLCNGIRDCADYSDEDTCAEPFVCGGEILPPTAVCNLVSECADGSDEADCSFVCGS